MRAGQLRHKVKIQTAAGSTGSYGTDPNKETYTTIATRRARIAPMTGAEQFQGQQIYAEATTQIGLRWDSAIADLSPKYRIVDASSTGRVYDIIGVINLEERDRELRVMAKERV